MTAPRLVEFVKAYDVRGLVPEQLSPAVARALGEAFAQVIVLPDGDSSIVIGYDMRPSSPELSTAFAEGAAAHGVDVTVIGLCSTDGLYYASGTLDRPGAMFTASHNPAQYNGIKLCRAGARPVSQDTGLAQMRDLAQAILDGTADAVDARVADPSAARANTADDSAAGGQAQGEPSARHTGVITEQDMLGGYADFLLGLVDLSGIQPLKVVVDAGNGMGGHTVPAVLNDLPLEVIPLYFELDGTFPNHEANPLEPANLVDLQAAVREHHADIGLAFDGDADRCFVVNERGEAVSPSTITALVATREIAREVATGTDAADISVVYNLISSQAVPEIVSEHGAQAVRTRVGHSYIKTDMAQHQAVFGGEHSAHYYFRDFWFADTGMLAALHVLAALGESTQPLSEVVADYSRYVASGEINSRVDDTASATARVREWALAQGEVVEDTLDGLTLTHRAAPMWWLNLRASNTEPLLRLNVEAADEATMHKIRDGALALVREEGEATP